MKYKIIENAVIETNTNYTLMKSPNMKKLRTMKLFLNGGGGFNGRTPRFVFQGVRP